MSCGDDSVIRVWRVASGECIAKLRVGKQREGGSCAPHAAVFIAAGSETSGFGSVLSAGHDGRLRIWDVAAADAVRNPSPMQQPKSARREQLEAARRQATDAKEWAAEEAVSMSHSRLYTPERLRSTNRSCGSIIDSQVVVRQKQLSTVFRVMDLDGSGYIEVGELMRLGTARRELRQRQGEWTEQKNIKLLCKIDANSDGKISCMEFAEHFERAMPEEQLQFDAIIEQFMQVARSCTQQDQHMNQENELQSAQLDCSSSQGIMSRRLAAVRRVVTWVCAEADWVHRALQFCTRIQKRYPAQPPAHALLKQLLSDSQSPVAIRHEHLVVHLEKVLPADATKFTTALTQCSKLLAHAISANKQVCSSCI